jgi:hypothetical protein
MAQGRHRLVDQFAETFVVMGVIDDDLDIHVCPFKLVSRFPLSSTD